MHATDLHRRSRVTFRLDELVIDCSDPDSLARFWAQLLDYEVADADVEMCAIEDTDGSGPSICFQKVADEKLAKNRLHFDLDVAEGMLDEAVSEIVALGGRRVDVGQPRGCSWAVMADPEGNEFCVVA